MTIPAHLFSEVFGASGKAICAYGNENDPINSLRRWPAQRLVSGGNCNQDPER